MRGDSAMLEVRSHSGCEFTTIPAPVNTVPIWSELPDFAVRGTSVCGPEWAAPQKTPAARGNVPHQVPTSVPVAIGVGQPSDDDQGLHRSEYRRLATLVCPGWSKG